MMSYGDPGWRDWILPESEARPFLELAIDSGINFFDTADMYSRGVSEEILGRAIDDLCRREEVVIATKVYFPMSDDPNNRGLSRAHIMDSIDKSLSRLGMEYVDLYQIHRWDRNTPIEETLEALNDIVRQGKARYIGASSMFAWQFARALCVSERRDWSRFVSMQNHYNLIYREEEREMVPMCLEEGVGLLPWSPLARGFLAGTRRREDRSTTARAKSDEYARSMYFEDVDFEVLDEVRALAKVRGVTPAQIALAWLLHKPGVTAPIIGATRLDHLREAVAALDIELSDEEIDRLESPYVPHPVLGHR
jgi:aryl-alcohol dehydrogenase (NADP+)